MKPVDLKIRFGGCNPIHLVFIKMEKIKEEIRKIASQAEADPPSKQSGNFSFYYSSKVLTLPNSHPDTIPLLPFLSYLTQLHILPFQLLVWVVQYAPRREKREIYMKLEISKKFDFSEEEEEENEKAFVVRSEVNLHIFINKFKLTLIYQLSDSGQFQRKHVNEQWILTFAEGKEKMQLPINFYHCFMPEPEIQRFFSSQYPCRGNYFWAGVHTFEHEEKPLYFAEKSWGSIPSTFYLSCTQSIQGKVHVGDYIFIHVNGNVSIAILPKTLVQTLAWLCPEIQKVARKIDSIVQECII